MGPVGYSRDIICNQSEHPIVRTGKFHSVEEYCLHLIHLRAYEKAAQLTKNKAVLEIGCNNGYGSSLLKASCGRLTGIDVSKKAVINARKSFLAPQLEFALADGAKLPFKSETFEVVIAMQVLEHLIDPGEVIEEAKRVLSPGGFAIFTTPNSRLRLKPGMKPWNEFHVREFDSNELKELMATHFSRVRVLGLFATEPLDSVERNRVNREKNRFVNSAERGIVEKLKARLPRPITLSLKTVKAKVRQAVCGNSVKPFMLEHNSTSCLSYADYDIESALDLMAICESTRTRGIG